MMKIFLHSLLARSSLLVMFQKICVIVSLRTLSVVAVESGLVDGVLAGPAEGHHSETHVVDPCITYCHLLGGGNCNSVYSADDICVNLIRGPDKSIVVASDPVEKEQCIKTSEAFEAVSTPSCDSACDQTPGCAGSFCKPNDHCQGLFWEKSEPKAFCFHSEKQPCNPHVPLLCAAGKKHTTPKPHDGSLGISSTMAEEAKTRNVATPTPEVTSTLRSADRTTSHESTADSTPAAVAQSLGATNQTLNSKSSSRMPILGFGIIGLFGAAVAF